MLPLSVFIIARNEADRLGATIRAVRDLTDDLIVVDSGSTDGTQALAESLGARVIHHDWPGYGPQKRFAEEQCRHAWLLNLDADEVVPDTLAGEIRALFAKGEPAHPAWRIGIAEIFPGEAKPHPSPTRSIRCGSTGRTGAAIPRRPSSTGWIWSPTRRRGGSRPRSTISRCGPWGTSSTS